MAQKKAPGGDIIGRMATKVFISWSGERSKQIAEAVKDLLRYTVPVLEPWMSSEDIEKGTLWANELAKALKSTVVGIVCLTPENLKSPWILFEAGALYRTIQSTRVCTLLCQVNPRQLEGPLQQFQSSTFDKDDIRRLLKTIKGVLGPKPPEWTVIESTFEEWRWPIFEEKIKGLNSSPPAAAEPTQDFPKQLRDLLANPPAELMELLKRVAPSSLMPGAPQETSAHYYFLNHTSFLRKNKQEDFIKRTGVYAPHYDIRIVLDSSYPGALDRVEKVEYTLDPTYPTPIYTCSDRSQKFLLKELANGESVVQARVYFCDGGPPMSLQRYLTLWESGPRLP